jgi:hypothetical protein
LNAVLAVMVAALLQQPQDPPPPPYQVVNIMPRYWAFRDSTDGFPIAEQVRVFRQMVIAAEPRFYDQVIGTTSDERLAEYLTTMAALDSAMRRISREMVNAIPGAWGRVAGFFRGLAPGLRIYVVPSVFQSNGQVRYVDDSMVVMLGPDVQTYVEVVIDSGRKGMTSEIGIEHELSHYQHWKLNPEVARAAKSFFRPGAYSSLYYNLWSEGFATWVARRLNPEQPLAAILGPGLDPAQGPGLLPALAREFLARFESTREDDVRDLFYLSGRRKDVPLRSAYYVGYQVASFLARSRTPTQLAALRGEDLRRGVRDALTAMADGRWAAVD